MCIHVEQAVIYGKEMRGCTHKRDNPGSSIIILEENLFQTFGLTIAVVIPPTKIPASDWLKRGLHNPMLTLSTCDHVTKNHVIMIMLTSPYNYI